MSVETKKTIIDVLKAVIILVLIISVIFLFVFENSKTYILGLVFGASVSFLLFIELAITISKAVTMRAEKANSYTALKYNLRLLIFGVVIFISIKSPYINVIGTVIGLLSVKFVIYFINIFINKNSQRKEE